MAGSLCRFTLGNDTAFVDLDECARRLSRTLHGHAVQATVSVCRPHCPTSVLRVAGGAPRDGLARVVREHLHLACHLNAGLRVVCVSRDTGESRAAGATPHGAVPAQRVRRSDRRVRARNTHDVLGEPVAARAPGTLVVLEPNGSLEGHCYRREHLRAHWAKADNREYTGLYRDGTRTDHPGLFVFRLFDNRLVLNAWDTLEAYPGARAFVLQPLGRHRVGSSHHQDDLSSVVYDREEEVYAMVPYTSSYGRARGAGTPLPNASVRYDDYGHPVADGRPAGGGDGPPLEVGAPPAALVLHSRAARDMLLAVNEAAGGPYEVLAALRARYTLFEARLAAADVSLPPPLRDLLGMLCDMWRAVDEAPPDSARPLVEALLGIYGGAEAAYRRPLALLRANRPEVRRIYHVPEGRARAFYRSLLASGYYCDESQARERTPHGEAVFLCERMMRHRVTGGCLRRACPELYDAFLARRAEQHQALWFVLEGDATPPRHFPPREAYEEELADCNLGVLTAIQT